MDVLAKLLDQEGLLLRWPKKPEERQEVLKYLLTKFGAGKTYTEMEINAILKKWHKFNDHPMLRRELVDHGLLNRTPDGKAYQVVEA